MQQGCQVEMNAKKRWALYRKHLDADVVYEPNNMEFRDDKTKLRGCGPKRWSLAKEVILLDIQVVKSRGDGILALSKR